MRLQRIRLSVQRTGSARLRAQLPFGWRDLAGLTIVRGFSLGFDLFERRQVLRSSFEELFSPGQPFLTGHQRHSVFDAALDYMAVNKHAQMPAEGHQRAVLYGRCWRTGIEIDAPSRVWTRPPPAPGRDPFGAPLAYGLERRLQRSERVRTASGQRKIGSQGYRGVLART